MKDGFKITGRLVIDEWDVLPDGKHVWAGQTKQENLVTLAGRDLVRDLIIDKTGDALSHFAVGTDVTAATANDTTLGGEVFRAAFTTTTSSSAAIIYKYFLGASSANGNTLAEAGLLNAGAAGTLFARTILASTIIKTSAKAYTFTWTVNINAT